MKNGCSVYVHIPFCKARCGYCAFSSCTDFALEDRYFDVLCAEIVRAQNKNIKISTIFWGGGTPSCVKIENLRKLFSTLRNSFDLTELDEFTVECNPESTTEGLLLFLKSIGVNRLSFGLQSANDATLKKIGRLHTFADFKYALNLSRKCGFHNVNADLILGLPESFEEFCNTAETVRTLPLTHISLYALEIHPEKEAFKALCDSYGYTDDDLADMYDFAVAKFAEAGFDRYEISNFAKSGFECQHNLNYWREGRYFGFGAAASGFVGNVRYGNAFDIKKYIDFGDESVVGNRVGKSKDEFCLGVAKEYCDEISSREEMNEFVMLGLRLRGGIAIGEFSTRFRANFFDCFPAAEILVRKGFLTISDGRIFVPAEKLYVLNSVLVELLPD